MAEDARWSINFCCVLDGGRSVGVVVPDRRDCALVGVSVSATFGIDLFRFALLKSPPTSCGESRDGRKLLLPLGVPAEPSPSIKRDTRSLPGVSTNVEPALWLKTRASWESDITVAAICDIWGGGLWDELRWRSLEVIISASGGLEWWCELARFVCRGLCVRSGNACEGG